MSAEYCKYFHSNEFLTEKCDGRISLVRSPHKQLITVSSASSICSQKIEVCEVGSLLTKNGHVIL